MAEGKGTHTAEQETASTKRPPWWKRFWGWTEFGKKSGWNWLELLSALAIPVVLAAAGLYFEAQLDERQRKIEDQRAKLERELEEQRAQDAALQAYLDQMSNLLLERDLRETEPGSEVRTLARARTLTVLGRSDPSRKTEVMRFLGEAGLVQGVDGNEPVISLVKADLRGADLRFANLTSAGLEDADLSYADLSDADLSGADLAGADLRRANLGGAKLDNADLSSADLTSAEGVTEEELEQAAASLAGTTMPDGSVHAGRYTTLGFEPALSLWLSGGLQLGEPETGDTLKFSTGAEGGQLIFSSSRPEFPLYVFDPSTPSEPKEVPAPANADEWASWFQRHPNLETSKPVSVNVGGASGLRIDITETSAPENYSRDLCGLGQPCVPLYPLYPFSSSIYGSSKIASYGGWKDRFVIVDVEGATVVINISAPEDKFDVALPKAQKALDTVEWKGAQAPSGEEDGGERSPS